MEARRDLLALVPLFPQHMGAREGGVTAQVDFHLGGKPAQVVAVVAPAEKRGFGLAQLCRDRLHPAILLRLVEQHHRRRVPREGLAGKGVDQKEG